MSKLTVSIVGASGYTGGELIRLLLRHDGVELAQATSRQYLGKFLHAAHPNLRGSSRLRFTDADQLEPCDVLFLCLPHGKSSHDIDRYSALAGKLIDLSADFRLNNAADYRRWYGEDHAKPDQLGTFVYGLPEFHREQLRTADRASGVGCNATATNLALMPLARAGLIEQAVVEVKVGSSEGGNAFSLATHHPERSGSFRSFAPTGHRHQAEIQQEIGPFPLHFSATAVEMVRGVLCTAHAILTDDVDEKQLWSLYREQYGDEPFVRLVREKRGIFRLPEPKLVAGTNLCDIGFEKDPDSRRVVVISALDNLMKGAAGSAVQSMNVMQGFDETKGLNMIGLHP